MRDAYNSSLETHRELTFQQLAYFRLLNTPHNAPMQWKARLQHPFIRNEIKLTAAIIEEYHSYKVKQNFIQHSSVNINAVWELSVWILMEWTNTDHIFCISQILLKMSGSAIYNLQEVSRNIMTKFRRPMKLVGLI